MQEWENEGKSLKRLLPIIRENHVPKSMPRRESSVYVRLRIGHTYFTHCHLLKNEPAPFCIGCNETITVDHILTNCAEYIHIRHKHYQSNTLEDVLALNNIKNVMAFLKEINTSIAYKIVNLFI